MEFVKEFPVIELAYVHMNWEEMSLLQNVIANKKLKYAYHV